MDYATIFNLANLGVVPFWLLMILLPNWSLSRRMIASPLIALVPASLYLLMVVPQIAALWPAISNPSVAGIAALLSTPTGATIAWAHFLAFDLLVGRWIFLDARERSISALLMAPVLFFTFMFGPIGYLAYLGLRAAMSLRNSQPRQPVTA